MTVLLIIGVGIGAAIIYAVIQWLGDYGDGTNFYDI